MGSPTSCSPVLLPSTPFSQQPLSRLLASAQAARPAPLLPTPGCLAPPGVVLLAMQGPGPFPRLNESEAAFCRYPKAICEHTFKLEKHRSMSVPLKWPEPWPQARQVHQSRPAALRPHLVQYVLPLCHLGTAPADVPRQRTSPTEDGLGHGPSPSLDGRCGRHSGRQLTGKRMRYKKQHETLTK